MDNTQLSAYRPVHTPQRLYEGVVRQISRLILCDTLAPGEYLPSEPVLAQQFGVSRTVIREAFRILVGKGLIAVKHGSGVQVQPPEQWNHLDPLVLFERLRTNRGLSLLTELLELRRIIEGESAALAALRHTPEDIHLLRNGVEAMRGVVADSKVYMHLDVAFHDAILSAARNRLLSQALRPARQSLMAIRLISSQRTGGPIASLHGHEDILAAIEQRDQEQARMTMRAHIMQFEEDFLAIFSTTGFTDSIIELTHDFL